MIEGFSGRVNARSLTGAVAVGALMGLILGAAYFAGDAARTKAERDRSQRLVAAAREGFSESALKAQAAGMSPGALAIARRHDPFTNAGSAQRDRQSEVLSAQITPPAGPAAEPAKTKASRPVAARPFHLAGADALISTRELDCLSAAVYYEARGESAAGQAAIAQVVLNRVRHPAFPKSVCGVVYQGAQSHTCQFSFACDGSMRRSREPAAWNRARAIAGKALGGQVMASVGNATHFHVASLGQVWGVRLLQVARVGSHVFYRFAGRAGGPGSFHGDSYDPASELAEQPVYQRPAESADGVQEARLVLAAVTSPTAKDASPQPTTAAPARPSETRSASAESDVRPAG